MNNFSINSLGLNINTKKKLEHVETFLNSKKDTLLNALGPNPLTTPVGIKIDIATSPEVTEDNWAKYLEICDIVNATADGPKDASRAIRRKLVTYAGKYNHSIVHILNLLDCCVKNCGHRFHLFVSQREFIADLIKILNPKYQLSITMQERVLKLIQSWAAAFKGYPDLQGVVQVNNELRAKGIELPFNQSPTGNAQEYSHDQNVVKGKLESFCADMEDNGAPIFTPALAGATAGASNRTNTGALSFNTSRSFSPTMLDDSDTTDIRNSLETIKHGQIPQKDISKLRGELEIVQTNVQLLSDILGEKLNTSFKKDTTSQDDPEDFALIKKLYSICKDMQLRIMDLLERVTNEELLTNLLKVNDSLNDVFNKYDRFEKSNIGFSSLKSPEEFASFNSPSAEARIEEPQKAQNNNFQLLSPQRAPVHSKRPETTLSNSSPKFQGNNDNNLYLLAKPTINVKKPIEEPSLIQFEDENTPPNFEANIDGFGLKESSELTLEQIDPFYTPSVRNAVLASVTVPDADNNNDKITGFSTLSSKNNNINNNSAFNTPFSNSVSLNDVKSAKLEPPVDLIESELGNIGNWLQDKPYDQKPSTSKQPFPIASADPCNNIDKTDISCNKTITTNNNNDGDFEEFLSERVKQNKN